MAEDLFDIGFPLRYPGSKVLITDESDYAFVLSDVVKDIGVWRGMLLVVWQG